MLTDDDTVFYLFRESKGRTLRETWPIDRLMEKVNSGEWELEFTCRYDGYREVLHACCIWQERKPWSMEAQLFIPAQEPEIFLFDMPDER